MYRGIFGPPAQEANIAMAYPARRLALAATLVAAFGTPAVGAAADTPPAATTIYVSPSGSDADPGTLTQPIRTLAHAQELVRGLDQDMSADITVALESGTYRLSAPLSFDASDS